MEIIIFALGVLLGSGITWFLTKNTKSTVETVDYKQELDAERQKVLELNTQVARLEEKNNNYEKLLKKEEEMQKKLTTEFENIASKILKENTSEFSKTNQEEIVSLLKPFKEKISEFGEKIEKTRNEEIKDISSLKTEIKLLTENNQKLSEDANNLAEALKGQNKAQGNWGEMILQRILEMSGLREDYEYSMQSSFKNEEGRILRPDVVVHLPENKHLIIDSKVSLLAYESFHNAEDEAEKEAHLKEFVSSLKSHIKGLSDKAYQDAEGANSPDFVLMFIPVEASFHLLFQNDNSILDFAWDKKIMLVGPSTLLAALKTINLFWNQEKQTKNVLEIVKESGAMYDKFVGLLEDISRAKGCIENAFTKLSGRGNIIRRIEKLKDLGAKTSKPIPEKYLLEGAEAEEVV